MENQSKSPDTGPARLCISGLQFECRECHAKRTVPVADPRTGEVTHICQHWDDPKAMKKGMQPWQDISELCRLLVEMSDRLKGCDLRIPLDITIVR